MLILVVAFRTLKAGMRQHEASMRAAYDQFEISIENQAMAARASFETENQRNRVSVMPYLFLEPHAELIEEKDSWYFKLSLKNLGNGAAIDVFVVTDDSLIIEVADTPSGEVSHYLTDPTSQNVVPINQCTHFMMKCRKHKEAYNLHIKITFKGKRWKI